MKKTTKKEQAAPGRPNYDQMNDQTMNDLLMELSGSKFWPAILRYNYTRDMLADQVLRSIDPFKNPTESARNQGFISGIVDLESYITEETTRRAKAEKSEPSE